MSKLDYDSTTTRRGFLKSAGIGSCSAVAALWAAGSQRLLAHSAARPRFSPEVRGRTPWAVILCAFNDVPPLRTPISEFNDFVALPGKGGMFDYFRDISYGAIDLTGSKVIGPYKMKYSFFKDAASPEGKCGDGKARCAWTAEAIRLAKENREDLSAFYGVIAVVNASVDDSNTGRNLALGIDEPHWGQSNWRWCEKCKGLAFAGSGAGVCPAGGPHVHNRSADYTLALGAPGIPGQNNWRYCKSCKGLAFAGSGAGVCPAGGPHNHTGSGDYTLGIGAVGFPGQNNWRYCRNCKGLAFAGDGPGVCPAGSGGRFEVARPHDHKGSGDYTLVSATARPFGYASHLNNSFGAHEMLHGYGLSHAHCAGKDVDYCCPWDIMGPGSAAYTPSSGGMILRANPADHFAPLGPGLCAPQLLRLGWMPNERVKVVTPGTPTTGQKIKLVALNRPDMKGYLMVKIVGTGGDRTVEFRQPTKWDRGLPGEAVLMHEVRAGGEPLFLGDYRAGQRWADLRNGISVVVETIDTASATATITI